jgi:hypothetical protein
MQSRLLGQTGLRFGYFSRNSEPIAVFNDAR